MYFTDLTNPELQKFHRMCNIQNFSISLTDMLTSPLFKVEPITADIFRIYPLFYCEKIEVNDESSRVLENKVLITNKTDDEKYFNFISNDDIPFLYDNGLNYHNYGEELSPEDFNAFVQILRNQELSENIRMNNKEFIGDYGEYLFDFKDVSIVDNGILITNETLQGNHKVMLSNPVFENSSYFLNLRVFSVSDVNVMDDYITNNVHYDEITLELTPYTWVEIPLDDLEFNRIISFDAEVVIVHDKPIIQFNKHIDLTVTSSGFINTPVTLTAVYEESGTLLEGKTLTFYDGDTVLGTAVTDNEGVAVFVYTPEDVGSFDFNVACLDDGISNKPGTVEPVVIVKHDVNITFTSNKTLVYVNNNQDSSTEFTVSGVVTSENNPVTNGNVNIYNGETLLDTVVTDNNGAFSKALNPYAEVQSYNLKAEYAGDDNRYPKESSFVNVVARRLNTVTTLTVSPSSMAPEDTATFSGTVKDESGVPIPNANVSIHKNNGTSLFTVTCDNTGAFSVSKTAGTDFGDDYHFARFNASASGKQYTHNNSDSSRRYVEVTKLDTRISISVDNNQPYSTDYVTVTASVTSDTRFNPSDVIATIDGNSQLITEKDSEGNFIFTLPRFNTTYGTHTVSVKYNGSNRYNSCESNQLTVRYVLKTRIDVQTTSLPNNQWIYSGQLIDIVNNTPIPNKQLTLNIPSENWSSTNYTDDSGYDRLSPPFSGKKAFTFTFNGDTYYGGSSNGG